ncbi:hypothetical protein MNBD_CPR01-220 [hydrothermal vent metagenome]|uniref:Uncharacterized protein n=1 Tax=hydrothermal vent metagenome TaxID=652676 RepID=A0A3B0V659_9ZZZZ
MLIVMKIHKEIAIGSIVASALIAVLVVLLVENARPAHLVTKDIKQNEAVSTNYNASSTTVHATDERDRNVSKVITYSFNKTPDNILPIDKRDSIASWSFTPASGIATTSIQNKIIAFSREIGSGKYPNYAVYIQIAQEYEMLGDGHSAYRFYMLAIKDSPQKGLAFNNLGNLMTKLGAYNTANNAYAKSVALKSSIKLYWLSYLNFLSVHEKSSKETAHIFAEAMSATDNDPDIRIARAQWEESIGNITEAISDWRAVRFAVGEEQQKAIDLKIESLQNKQ